MVGLYAEKKPEGFGISDTAFRVFLLMASRRLKSDRFFTTDYTPEIYTRQGIDWVENNTMRTVLLRHYPALAPALYGVKNAFGPWNDVLKQPQLAGA
jgi:heme peroxidase